MADQLLEALDKRIEGLGDQIAKLSASVIQLAEEIRKVPRGADRRERIATVAFGGFIAHNGPHQTHSQKAIDVADQLMKALDSAESG